MVFNRDKNKETIFRQESLERLSSPERLDQLMQVVNPQDWLALAVFGGLTTIGLIWSIFGRIPINVEGKGVLIQPRQIVEFQSSIAGQLKSLQVKNGQCVKKDEVLATVDPADTRQQLQLAKGKLEQLQKQATDALFLSDQRMQLEKNTLVASRVTLEKRLQDARAITPVLKAKGLDAIKEQQINLQQRLKDTQILTPILKDKGLSALGQQRISIQERLKDAQALVPILGQKLQKRRELAAAGAIAAETILEVEHRLGGATAQPNINQNLRWVERSETQPTQLQVIKHT